MTTSLGVDAFFVDKLAVKEELNEVSSIYIHCHSRHPGLSIKEIIGKNCRIEIRYAPFSIDSFHSFSSSNDILSKEVDNHSRYFSGIVSSIEQGITDEVLQRTYYMVQVCSPFWLLKFNQDYRIFQNTSPKDICATLFQEHNLLNVSFKNTQNGMTVRKYCVQYGESALDFTTRLLSEEGLFFISTSTSTGEQLDIYDDVSHLSLIEEASVSYHPHKVNACFHGTIQSFYKKLSVTPHKASLCDYNFISPSTKLFLKTEGEGEGGMVYTYPGRFFSLKTGESLNKIHMERLESDRELCHGQSTVVSMRAGGKFKMIRHPVSDFNTEYVIHSVEHELTLPSSSHAHNSSPESKIFYSNRFTCAPSSQVYRPPLKEKPRIHSNQMARVVGPPGEDVHTDEFGRIKVQFYWDQRGEHNDKSSCWLRVAQGWSGPHFGIMFIPRIGTEVIVSFFEGDPDRPIVIGCAYNGDHRPPYPLPLEKTKSVIRSRSVKAPLERYNEISFDDVTHAEDFYMRAQKHYRQDIMDGDSTTTIHKGNALIEHTAKGEEKPIHRLHLVRGQHIIDLDEGDQIMTFKKGNQQLILHQGDASTTLHQGNMTIEIKNGNATVLLNQGSLDLNLHQGNLHTNVEGEINVTATKEIALKTDASFSCKASTFTINASGKVEIEAGADLSIKAGGSVDISGSSIKLNGGMVTIGGGIVKIG